MGSYKGATNHHLETTNQPVVLVVPDSPLVQFRKNPKARFQKPLTLLQLTATVLGITHHQPRHKLGLSYPALPHQKNPLAFFGLLRRFTTHHPTHKREVC